MLICGVVCRFCKVSGREERPGRKRKATNNAQYYTTPFRPESYRKHNELQHPSKWSEYQALADEKKGDFWDGVVPIKNTLLSHFWSDTTPRLFEFDVTIVEMIVGGMYFDVDDGCGSDDEADEMKVTRCADDRRLPTLTPLEIKKRALRIFVPVRDSPPENGENVPVSAYKLTIKNGSLFDMVVEFASLGSSFCLNSRLVQSMREFTGMACYSGCNSHKVSSFLCVMCASNLQMLCDILTKC
ncbi:hypothetical protein BWQ96_07960 [Gracilariopsis chorda]|uniref:Uncharacterized protein n=1 Tax=Gracilariopsis chorda TaxID=448386 RepID=A0A2V3IJQ2_9FLOR|nr:hypothetical protein BWQ96_07960 [Gracilariopsis chorda]|eukprot:PXF42325.1 hypothetical protein BWQ96_07960 [Gracilariopsis chorda]